jgi:hypothetical protein
VNAALRNRQYRSHFLIWFCHLRSQNLESYLETLNPAENKRQLRRPLKPAPSAFHSQMLKAHTEQIPGRSVQVSHTSREPDRQQTDSCSFNPALGDTERDPQIDGEATFCIALSQLMPADKTFRSSSWRAVLNHKIKKVADATGVPKEKAR